MISTKRPERNKQLRSQIQQLILLRETGPKSAAWHAARSKLIWRLHDELKAEESGGRDEGEVSQSHEVDEKAG